jgi:hypothetical protein
MLILGNATVSHAQFESFMEADTAGVNVLLNISIIPPANATTHSLKILDASERISCALFTFNGICKNLAVESACYTCSNKKNEYNFHIKKHNVTSACLTEIWTAEGTFTSSGNEPTVCKQPMRIASDCNIGGFEFEFKFLISGPMNHVRL